MTQTLTQIIANLQAQLIDDGTRFDTDTCTAAVRGTLADLNHKIPINAATRIDVIANQYEYELTDEDVNAVAIIDILQWDTGGEEHKPLDYNDYTEDERVFFRLKNPLASGEILARYTVYHTISGLDSATTSTLSADLDQILTDGACYRALLYRAASRVETINLQQAVSDNYREIMSHYKSAYEHGIAAHKLRNSPVSQPRTDSWNNI